MHRNRSVDTHRFAMVPRAEIPRAAFSMQRSHKTTFNGGVLVPVFCEEVLPGDSFRVKGTLFARLSTPLFPIMDNLHLESFFFFVPNRLVWTNWVKFMGQQDNPGDSTSYVIPQLVSSAGGFPTLSIYDYFGLPTVGQVAAGKTVSVNALPLRAYNLIWSEWFRDENMVPNVSQPRGDGPDLTGDFSLMNRGKRHDYFTSCLPFPQKGNAVSLPLGGTAPVIPSAGGEPFFVNAANPTNRALYQTSGGTTVNLAGAVGGVGLDPLKWGTDTGLVADLSSATAATINAIRQAFQVQKLLERDARGGTRYAEIVRSHFGVVSPDARLQRPEYLGGGSTPVVVNPVGQTSATGAGGSTTPLGTLAAMGTVLGTGHGFSQAFTEHGYIIGLIEVRADLSYQQGLRRHWSRSTRYDFYFPAFATLGEQAVLNKEIYVTGDTTDTAVFGYQERWAEYRYSPSEITGLFRSTSAGTIDPWHLAEKFNTLPVLNNQFIADATGNTLQRIIAVGSAANGQQLILDSFWDMKVARPMPLYSVPGLIDHF